MLPTAVTLPITVASWLLLTIRLLRFRTTLVERRFNMLLMTVTAILTTHEPTLRGELSALTGGRLSIGLIYQFGAIGFMFSTAASLLVAAAMLGRAQSAALVYGLAGASCAVGLLFSGPAQGPSPFTMYEQPGWGQFGFWLALAPLSYWMVFHFGRVCLAEMRTQHARRERALHATVLGAGCTVFLMFSLTFVSTGLRALGHENRLTRAQLVIDNNAVFFQALPFLVMGAVPVAAWLIDTIGLDAWSRRRKRLLPLWFDLTEACPEIVHRTATPVAAHRSRYFLHRTVIEIRDSVLILARYATATPPELRAAITACAGTTSEREALDLAVRLVRACAAKARGDEPTGAVSLPHCAGDNLAEEAAQLAAIAAQWSRARALVGAATISVAQA
ncbi:MAB_1171c family putative transporter [Nocardia sp. NPDC052316]|uniref:MAB_1171c family putative transporter n=1 Tax=Nocardia sp. NPDC052316 TaxID=3364329 RepID=UPI0037C74888